MRVCTKTADTACLAAVSLLGPKTNLAAGILHLVVTASRAATTKPRNGNHAGGADPERAVRAAAGRNSQSEQFPVRKKA
jgi:hypothetical protein